jgi:hypothetical protein
MTGKGSFHDMLLSFSFEPDLSHTSILYYLHLRYLSLITYTLSQDIISRVNINRLMVLFVQLSPVEKALSTSYEEK